MKRLPLLLLASLSVVVGGSAAVYVWTNSSDSSPYADLNSRTIKSLSAKDIADLREGRGKGYALTAELNGYPGPRHVLDLDAGLKLTAEQKVRTQALFDQMKDEASALGEELISMEKSLDDLFASRKIDPDTLAQKTADAALIEGRLRATHLKYHLAMLEVLAPEQVQAYVKLRGYHGGAHH